MSHSMQRVCAAVSISALTAWGALSAQTQTQAPQPRPPVFRAGAVLVTVDAYPQKDGRLVEGLTAADFEILEDGKPQAVDSLELVKVQGLVADSERRDPNTNREAWDLASDPHNRVFVVYLDTPHVTIEGSRAIRQPLVSTLNRLIAPNDLFGVMTPAIEPRFLAMGRRLEGVEEQLTRHWPWGERNRITPDPADAAAEQALTTCFSFKPDGKEWFVNEEGLVRRLDQVLIGRRREDRVLTSLENTLLFLSARREARTVMLLLSDGWRLYQQDLSLAEESRFMPTAGGPGVVLGPGGRMSTPSRLDGNADPAMCNSELQRLSYLDDQRRSKDLYTLANRANVSFYPVAPSGLAVFDSSISERMITASPGVSGLTVDANRLRNRVSSLQTIAENTDGMAIVNTNDLDGGMRKIVQDVSAYYLLTYYSTNTKNDGKFRRIELKLKQPGIDLRARRGYFAPSENDLKAAAAARPGTPVSDSDVPVDDVFGPLAKIRSGASAYISGAAREGELAVVVEIASTQMGGGHWSAGAPVRVTATTAGGTAIGTAEGAIEPGARGAVVRVALPAGTAGPWRVSASIGAGADRIEDRAEIKSGPGKLIGDPLIYRATPAPSSPLRGAADFQFRRTERIHIEWAMLGAVERQEARLLGRDGKPLPLPVKLSERETDGRKMLAADLSLVPLAPSDYAIEIVVGRGAESERRWVAFRIIQ